jgi:MAPEG family
LPSPILAPVIVLVLWTLVMCVWLYATRIPALAKYNIVYDPRRPSEEFHGQLPADVRWKADNYNNLLESRRSSMPWR